MLKELLTFLKDHAETQVGADLMHAMGRHAVSIEQWDQVAQGFFNLKRFKEAIPYSEKVLELANTSEQIYAAKTNLANVYAHAYYPERALEILDELEKERSNDPENLLKKSYSLYLLGKLDEAEKILKDQLINPLNDEKTRTQIEFNLGTYDLHNGKFYEGLYRFLIYGRKMDFWKKPELPFTMWDQIIRPGHFIVLRAEAGIGDEFINIRFAKHLKDLGMIPIWFTDRKDINKIFNRIGFQSVMSIDEIKNMWNGKNIYWIHSMDSPIMLRLEPKDLWYGSYLTADENIITPVEKNDRLKIGLRWQGNPDYDNDLHRNVPFKELFDQVKHLDADFYSLQRDVGLNESENCTEIVHLHKNYLRDFEETLAVIRDLDIVITSCTSIGHAAAAMGKRTFILIPMSAYYTWAHKTKQSPWYGDNLTLLKQKRPRYWDEPFAELTEYLKDY